MKTTLLRNRYNITKTALELKLSRQTLYNKLKKYGLI
ncbi:MAG: helix-turn-helix domain-containing protein [Firmicutes bacterium]|nr:helix-turn-helix domain-containing protein [Bacillota bacterium]